MTTHLKFSRFNVLLGRAFPSIPWVCILLARWFEICLLKITAKHYRQTGKKPEPDLVELVWLVWDSEEHFVRDDLKCRFLSWQIWHRIFSEAKINIKTSSHSKMWVRFCKHPVTLRVSVMNEIWRTYVISNLLILFMHEMMTNYDD